jgi:hypothetical protein
MTARTLRKIAVCSRSLQRKRNGDARQTDQRFSRDARDSGIDERTAWLNERSLALGVLS